MVNRVVHLLKHCGHVDMVVLFCTGQTKGDKMSCQLVGASYCTLQASDKYDEYLEQREQLLQVIKVAQSEIVRLERKYQQEKKACKN